MCNEGADEFDELMDKEDLQLSQVLDNDDVVSQFSNKNEKLLNFLDQNNRFGELIKFAITMPQFQEDQKYAYRYPFYACQILKQDSEFNFKNFFLKDDHYIYLSQLFTILKEQNPLNNVLAGYFQQILHNLIMHRTSVVNPFLCSNYFEKILNYCFIENPVIITDLFKHLNQMSITNTIENLIVFEYDEDEDDLSDEIINLRLKLIDKLLESFLLTEDEDITDNIGKILIQCVDEQKKNFQGSQLFNYIINHPLLIQLIKQLVNFKEIKKVNICNFLKSIIIQTNKINKTKIQDLQLFDLLNQNIDSYLKLVSSKKSKGVANQKLLQVIGTCCSSNKLINQYTSKSFWENLFSIFDFYPKCNMLHCEIVLIVQNIFQSLSRENKIVMLYLSQFWKFPDFNEIISMLHFLSKKKYIRIKQILFWISHCYWQLIQKLYKKLQNKQLWQIFSQLNILQEAWHYYNEEIFQIEQNRGNGPVCDSTLIENHEGPLHINILNINDLQQNQGQEDIIQNPPNLLKLPIDDND